MTVLRLRDGDKWLAGAPTWSTLSAVGWFSLAAVSYRFDRHFHDCAEYWAITEGRARIAVGDEEFDVGPGDLVCTPASAWHPVPTRRRGGASRFVRVQFDVLQHVKLNTNTPRRGYRLPSSCAK